MEKVKRGQISTEYLIVIAFVTFLIISVLGLSLFYSSQINDQIKFDQINSFANKVISSSEQVFFSGEPSRITITTYLPSGVDSINVLNDSIVFGVLSSSGLTTLSYNSDVPLYGTISNSGGAKRISIVANLSNINLVDA